MCQLSFAGKEQVGVLWRYYFVLQVFSLVQQ